MKRRFVKLFESAYTRSTNGGKLVGDIVEIDPKALNHPFFDGDEETKFKLKAMMNSGFNLRIINIKGKYPAPMGGNNDDNINRFEGYADVGTEIAPGRTTNHLTVPMEILKVVSGTQPEKDQSPENYNGTQLGINLPEIRDRLKYKARINIKPKPPEKLSEDEEFSPGRQTRTSDVGNKKDSSGDRALNNFNTPIPASPNETRKDPASYTADYLPKNVANGNMYKK